MITIESMEVTDKDESFQAGWDAGWNAAIDYCNKKIEEIKESFVEDLEQKILWGSETSDNE